VRDGRNRHANVSVDRKDDNIVNAEGNALSHR
jgi:hypothetical protein